MMMLQSYLSWKNWRQGQDTVDSVYSEYEPSGVSYQNSESYGSRPGTDHSLPAPHQLKVPVVTVTTPANNARLELIDWYIFVLGS